MASRLSTHRDGKPAAWFCFWYAAYDPCPALGRWYKPSLDTSKWRIYFQVLFWSKGPYRCQHSAEHKKAFCEYLPLCWKSKEQRGQIWYLLAVQWYSNRLFCVYIYTNSITDVLKSIIISAKNVVTRAWSRVVPPTETVGRKVSLHPRHGQINIMPLGQVSGLCCDLVSMSVFYLHGQ